MGLEGEGLGPAQVCPGTQILDLWDREEGEASEALTRAQNSRRSPQNFSNKK